MTYEDWDAGVKSKVHGLWNFHSLLPRGLDFFILLSSASGIFGSGGQANYAAGNTYMDALAHHRVAQGEKAVSLDIGWMAGEGVVAENEALSKSLEALGSSYPSRKQNSLRCSTATATRSSLSTTPSHAKRLWD